MRTAWQFVKLNGFTMSEALKKAWLNIKLQLKMRAGIVRFWFQKVDGSIREAWGTLRDTPPVAGSGRRTSPTVFNYFDTERQDWRCYKIANLIRVA